MTSHQTGLNRQYTSPTIVRQGDFRPACATRSAMLASGQNNKVIARELDISHNTVKLHVRHIMDKLNLRSRVEAAVFSFEYRSSADGIKAIGDGSPRPKAPPH